MHLRIVILLLVIIISLIFKYYIFQLQYFKHQLLEDFDVNNNNISNINDPNITNAIQDLYSTKGVISNYEDLQKKNSGVDDIVLTSTDPNYSNAINNLIGKINTDIQNVESSNSFFQSNLNQVNTKIESQKGSITSLSTQIFNLTNQYNADVARINAENEINANLINKQPLLIKTENFITGPPCVVDTRDEYNATKKDTDLINNCNNAQNAADKIAAEDALKNLAVKRDIIIYYNFNKLYDSKYVKNLYTLKNDLNIQMSNSELQFSGLQITEFAFLDKKTRTEFSYDTVLSEGKSLNCNVSGGFAAAMSNDYPGGNGSGNTYNFGKKFTIMFWIYYDGLNSINSNGLVWICNWNNPISENLPDKDISIRIENRNIIVAIGGIHFGNATSLNEKIWYHVAVTINIDNLKLFIYVNGVNGYNSKTHDLPPTISNNMPNLDKIDTIYIGASLSPKIKKNYGNFKGGYIDDFIVYSTDLTSNEINLMYDRNFKPIVTTNPVFTSAPIVVQSKSVQSNSVQSKVTTPPPPPPNIYLPVKMDTNVTLFKNTGSSLYNARVNKPSDQKNWPHKKGAIFRMNPSNNNKYCIYFANNIDTFISIPFINNTIPDEFTFCFNLYILESRYCTALSITDGDYPLIQCEFQGDNIYYYAEMKTDNCKRLGISHKNNYSLFNNWAHVAYTCSQNSKTIRLFVNGNPVNSAVSGNDRLASDKFFRNCIKKSAPKNLKQIIIGKSADNNRAFYGYVSEFKYFHSILTDAQIGELYKVDKMS